MESSSASLYIVFAKEEFDPLDHSPFSEERGKEQLGAEGPGEGFQFSFLPRDEYTHIH